MHDQTERPSQWMFWGCFIALITTAFAFITRAFMINTPAMWPADFGLDEVQRQVLFGHGLWSFAISIILFSLVIDRIGYRSAMVFSFLCYAVYVALALLAHSIVKAEGLEGESLLAARKSGLNYLTIGSIILGLGNGTVEAFINPVVATLFSRNKTTWLNILHAGWPGGLVLGGLLTLGLGARATEDWRLLIYIIAIPAVIYLLMLIGAKFPLSERVSGGATYREMLAEFGFVGAAIAGFLIFKQLAMTFFGNPELFQQEMVDWFVYGATGLATFFYGVYCGSIGRPLMIFLCLIMMPLATTELGTDGAITGIMEDSMKQLEIHPLWVLIYTSAIMMVLRFFAGPVVKALTPLGLLAVCALLAIVGLYSLSISTSFYAIFAAATLYACGKTYFWPTTLGVVAEQFPKGGALTLNAIAGIGMLTVGIIGSPLIGLLQEQSARTALEKSHPGVYQDISRQNQYILGEYTGLDEAKIRTLPQEEAASIEKSAREAKQGALAKVAIFPAIMLACYLILLAWFRSQGGYRAQRLEGSPAAH